MEHKPGLVGIGIGSTLSFILLLVFGMNYVYKLENTPKFKVGDCVTFYNDEWQSPASYEKIIEIGQRSYRVIKYFGVGTRSWKQEDSLEFRTANMIYHTMTCPEEPLDAN